MKKKESYENLAKEILEYIGGEDNVTFVAHCITRIRFNVKDKGKVQEDKLEKLDEIIGFQWIGEQLQIIIGQHVDKVYNYLCDIGGFKNQDEELMIKSKDKSKITLKGLGNSLLDTLSACLTPLIPMLIAAAMFKTIAAIIAPDMLNLVDTTDDIYVLLSFVGDAGFYFFPIIIGYTSAKKFGANPILGMFLGAILIHPTFVSMAVEGTDFSVFGIPVNVQSYPASIIPIILSVYALSHVEKIINKHLPVSLRTVFSPTISITIMLPISLCILGPAGAVVGLYISEGLLSLGDLGGVWAILATAIIAALWEFIIMAGMHWLLITSITMVITTTGYESLVSPAAFMAGFTVGGMCLGAALRIKNREQKSLSITYVISQLIGGVTEPGLYGVGVRYKKPFIGMMAGGLASGLYAGIVGLTVYNFIPVASFLCLFSFVGGSTMNFVHSIIAAIIAFIVSAAVTYFLGIEKKEEGEIKV